MSASLDQQDTPRPIIDAVVPNDILSKIFITAIHSNTSFDEGKVSVMRAPSILASVNRRWRALALNTPRIWTKLYVIVHSKKISGQIEQLALWIKRSRLCTLDVVLRDFTIGIVSDEACDALRQTLLPHAHRFATLILRMEGETVTCIVESWREWKDQFRFPQLRHFEIRPAFWDNEAWPPVVTAFLSASPSLEHLGCPRTGLPEKGIIPWSTLKVFRGGMSPTDVITLLSSSSSSTLEVLDLQVGNKSDQWDIPAPNEPYPSLPNLSSLSLVTNNPNFVLHHFPPLPGLRHLIINPDDGGPCSDGIPELLRLWGPNLLAFHIPRNASPSKTSAMLSLTPNLEALSVYPDNLTCISTETAQRIPHIAHLTIGFDCFDLFDQRTRVIKEYIREHRPLWPSLSELALIFAHTLSAEWDAETLDQLNRFRDGLKSMEITLYSRYHSRAAGSPVSHTGKVAYRFDTEYFVRKGGVFTELYCNV